MVITKAHLDRRTFLRGMGAAVALPLLDAMIPAGTALAATAGRGVPRLAFVYFPHGAVMDAWTPAAEDPIATLPPILDPLTPFAGRLTVVSGLENRHAHGPVHALTPGTWLVTRSPDDARTSGPDASAPTLGATADRIAADWFARDTMLASLELAAEEPRTIGTGGWDVSQWAGYGASISLDGASRPRPMETSPRRLFDRLFVTSSTIDPGLRARTRRSVLDLVADDAAALPRRLGARDRATVADYLDTVRDVECRVDRLELAMGERLDARPAAEVERAFTERQRLMFDLMALAFRADLTRVATFMMAAETSAMTYGHLGVSESFHLLSHHQYDRAKLDALVRIQQHHTRLLAGFVATLAETADGDGSLLDRSLILYGSNMSDSHAHDHFPLPLAVIGGGGTGCRGCHLRYLDRTPTANLLVDLLDRSGVPTTTTGDSTGGCARV